MPGPGMGPGGQPGPGPMGGMPGNPPQSGMPAGPGPTQPGPNPSGNGRFAFLPSTARTPLEQPLNVDVLIEGVPEGVSGQVVIRFDPRQLKLGSVTVGAGVEAADPPGGRESGQIVLNVLAGTGSRRLATLSLQGAASANTTLTVQSVRMVTPQGAELGLQPGTMTIEILGPRASWHVGPTDLPGRGLRI